LLPPTVLVEGVTLLHLAQALKMRANEFGVREDGNRLADRVIVIGPHQDSRAMAVLGDLDALMRGTRLVDELRQRGVVRRLGRIESARSRGA
jgi:hypothetical protein